MQASPRSTSNEDAIVLVGFMGTGKTEVGRRLAERLEAEFIDLDAEIEREAGMTIPEIFAREDEAGFRRREREALRGALRRKGAVVSCGGGVVVSPENLDALLQHPRVVCLTAGPETILRRIGDDPNRPLLRAGGEPIHHIRELLAARRELYDRIPVQVATDGFRPSEVVDRTVSELRKHGKLSGPGG